MMRYLVHREFDKAVRSVEANNTAHAVLQAIRLGHAWSDLRVSVQEAGSAWSDHFLIQSSGHVVKIR